MSTVTVRVAPLPLTAVTDAALTPVVAGAKSVASTPVTLSVNGVRYMEHHGLPRRAWLPDELLHSSVYIYFASWTYLGDPAVVRFHWGRIAISN